MCREHAASVDTAADALGSTFTGSRGTSPVLTFGVVALHQARLSDLHVEGFVLLVLLVVDDFHLDGFAEEEGRGRGGGKEKRRRGEEKAEKK